MLTTTPLGKGAEGVGYYTKYLEKGDVLGEPITPDVYQSAAARALGLGTTATAKQIEGLMRGEWNGRPLVQGAGEEHRAGIDLTFSAPKSVSLLRAAADMAGDPMADQLTEAHRRAVQKALSMIERDCCRSRLGKAGKEGMMSGSMVSIGFQHEVARADSAAGRLADMQLHTHNVMMNLVLGDDGKWRTLSNEEVFNMKMVMGAAYRAEYAKELRELGLKVEPDCEAFKVAGVSEAACNQFSKRRQTIQKAADELGSRSAKLMEKIANSTKSAKDRTVTKADLHDEWRGQLLDLGLTPEELIEAARSAEIDEELAHVIARDAVLSKLTENDSTFEARDVRRQAMIIAGHLALGADAGDRIAEELMRDKEILHIGKGKFTTRSMLAAEALTLDWAREASYTYSHRLDEALIDAAIEKHTLTGEQAQALKDIGQGGGISILEGMAGTGKSRTMLALREVAEASGFRVRGMALAGKAAAGLEEGAGIESSTIHRLLIDIEQGKVTLTDRDILVIDEAAMADNMLISKLADQCRKSGAKAVFLGDARQLQAIGSGGMFDHLTKTVGASKLTEIWRQNSAADIQSVHNFADGESGAALKHYKDNDRLHIESKTADCMQSMVDAWADDDRPMKDKLMMAGRRVDVHEINLIAREAVSGRLGRSMPVDTAEGRIDVAAGERILFKKNDKDLNIKNGEVGTVDRIIADRLTGRTYIQATLDDGRSAKFCTDEYDQIRYGYCVTAHASQGDTKQSAYIYASRFMSREMAYVMASRHKETAHIFASDEEFTEWSGLDTQTTEERIEFIMSTSHQKETAHQVMASHGYSIADILEGRASVDDLAADMTTDISSGLHGGMGTTK